MQNNLKTFAPRLKFIDAVRSIAILLMLEGHFISVTLDKTSFDNQNVFYLLWKSMRGFSAPMFFTVTGMVFVYLLCSSSNSELFIKKGIKRALKLLFWGFFLQFNLLFLNPNIVKNFTSWFFAFHVLHCISFGILVLIFIFKLFDKIKLGKLYIYYLVLGSSIFLFYPVLKSMPKEVYFPLQSVEFFQNIIKGPNSVFPIIPWMGFILYGGVIGAIIYKYKDVVNHWRFALKTIFVGLCFYLFSWNILNVLDIIFTSYHTSFILSSNLLTKFGQVVMIIGIMILAEKILVSNSLFLKIGQKTLAIYVLHVIILYGGFTGVGITNFLKNKLTPLESIFGAILFITFFVIFSKYYPVINMIINRLKINTSNFFKNLFIKRYFFQKKKITF